MKGSPEQQAAIETTGNNLLVAAAAGSGKTWVLVERIIRRIVDPNERMSVDRLLVVTFTNAAANEMRSRIGEALTGALNKPALSDAELRRHVERQLVLLNAASISTLHAFCQSIIRQYFYLLNIEPNFRIASDTEVTLIKSDVLEAIFEEGYTLAEPSFMTLVEHYGDEDGDNSLIGLVLKLYNFSRSHPWPDDWLDSVTSAFSLPESTNFDETPWSSLLRDKIQVDLEDGKQSLSVLMTEVTRPGNPAAYSNTFAQDIVIIDELLRAAKESWTALESALKAAAFPRIASVGKEVTKEIKDYYQGQRNKVKNRLADIRATYFERSEQELVNDLRQVAPVIAALVMLVKKFSEHYQAAKQAKGVVDFNDLEHLCLAVLRDPAATPANMLPSAIAKSLKTKFSEIMVDEYQDTNRVQEEIIRLVANEQNPNLFMVGDVKQSIYRFRLAEPALFMEKYHRYREGAPGCRRIDLSMNFRSRAEVLFAANFLFAQLMTMRTAELEYGEAEQLNPGPDYPLAEVKTIAGATEIIIINREKEADEPAGSEEPACEDETINRLETELPEEELSAFEQEALIIARKINDLIAEGYHVFDKQEKRYRPLMYRDIVILLRSVKGKAQSLQDVLRLEGIPCYAELDTGYFTETEVSVMLSLLKVIDNPRQDIALSAVLRSPIVAMTGDQLAELRLAKPEGCLWEALTAYARATAADDKIKVFLTRLSAWRNLARRKGVADLVWRVYHDTGYYDYVGGMPGGTLRQANLRALFDRARQYETTKFRGLFRFLRFIERLKDKDSDLSVARALGESEDVVRVMSIHKSKGLEFPVVILADLGKNFNLQDNTALVLCHKELGVGPYVTLPELRFRFPTAARLGLQHKIELETKAEELRVLYVALTRAREKLILVGSAKNLAKRSAVWCRSVGEKTDKLPASQVIKAKSYLDWIGMTVARHADGARLREIADCGYEPVGEMASHFSRWEIQLINSADIQTTLRSSQADDSVLKAVRELRVIEGAEYDTNWVDEILSWNYSCAAAVSKPSKLAVSEIKRRMELIEEEENGAEDLIKKSVVHARPRFRQVKTDLTAVEYGILTHTVMQHIRLKGELDPSGIVRQIQEMELRQIIPPGQAQAVDVEKIAVFFASGLGQRLLNASEVWRELPFSLMVPAENFYPDLNGCGEQIFIQGVIDCLFAEEDGLVLVDYKTDSASSALELATKYATQLSMYTTAVERIFKRPVKGQYLYALQLGQEVKLDSLG